MVVVVWAVSRRSQVQEKSVMRRRVCGDSVSHPSRVVVVVVVVVVSILEGQVQVWREHSAVSLWCPSGGMMVSVALACGEQ